MDEGGGGGVTVDEGSIPTIVNGVVYDPVAEYQERRRHAEHHRHRPAWHRRARTAAYHAYVHTRTAITTFPWVAMAVTFIILVLLLVLFVWAIVDFNTHGDHHERKHHHHAWDADAAPWRSSSGVIVDLEDAPISDAMRIVADRNMPSDYRNKDLRDVSHLVVLGDRMAGGNGVVADHDKWFNVLKHEKMPHVTIVDRTHAGDQSSDIATRVADLLIEFPAGLPGRAMLVVAVGALDLIDAVTPAPTTSVETALSDYEAALQSIASAASALFPHGVYVYVLDYADVSSGFGYVSADKMACDTPFDLLMNVPHSTPSPWTHVLDAHSSVSAFVTRDLGFAYVPVHFLFARLGGNRDLIRALPPALDDAAAVHHDDVFQSDCWTFNAEGHRKLADVLGAYIEHEQVLQFI